MKLSNHRGDNVISYRYDEFGTDPSGNQGQLQPFGYTGYQRDTVAGTYYAQAREYDAWSGRFTGEDVVKGSVVYPETLNAYGYCWGNPVKYVDRDGEFPLLAIVPVAFFMVAVLYGCNSNKKNGGKKSNQTTTEQITTTEYVTTTEEISKDSNTGISIDDYHVEDRKDLIEFIKYVEGEYWDKPYDSDENGTPDTIGYGHDFTRNGDSDKWLTKEYITLEEAEKLLLQDIINQIPYDFFHKLEDEGIYLTPNQIDAIVSLAFNVGAGELNTNSPNFTQLLISNKYTKEDIEKGFLTYLGEENVKEGLIKRRIAEAKIFNDGIYDLNYRGCDFE